MAEKILKVTRVIEYTGPEAWIVATLERSIGSGRPLRLGLSSEIVCTQVVSQDEATDKFADGQGNVRPPLVYIAGPFGADTPDAHQANVRRAALYRAPIARLGCYPVCPHTNTSELGGPTGKSSDPKEQKFWYDASMELLRRCDAIVMIPGWQTSTGAKMEKDFAQANGIPVLFSDHEEDLETQIQLAEWLAGR